MDDDHFGPPTFHADLNAKNRIVFSGAVLKIVMGRTKYVCCSVVDLAERPVSWAGRALLNK